MRRRTLLVALAGLAVVAAGVVVLWQRPSRVTWENYEQIAPGMTQAEVESILGTPGDYTTGPTSGPGGRIRMFVWPPEGASKLVAWQADDVCITVAFDASGRHLGCMREINNRIEQSSFANLLWRLKRQWHRWFTE
jgi:hypothetical protein